MKSFPTRLLLTCAAIGVVGAALLIPLLNVFSPAVVGGMPFVYMALVAVWVLPGLLALALLRRGGVALIVAVVSGLVAAPFNPYGIFVVVENLIVALFLELPFLIGLWRDWRAPRFLIAGAIGAFSLGLFSLSILVTAIPSTALLLVAIAIPILVGLALAFLARLIADRVGATGVLRGLRGPELRPRRGATTADAADATSTPA